MSTGAVQPADLQRPGRLRDMTLKADHRSKVRLGPASGVRFLREDGHYTPWVSASSLWTNHEGVFLRHSKRGATLGPDRLEGVAWGNIVRAEVRNFDGGKTVLATVAAGAIVALFAAAAAADINETKECAEGKGPCHNDSHLEDATQVAVLAGYAAQSSANDAIEEAGPDAPRAHYFSNPGTPRPSAEGARPLFTGGARRKAVIKGLVALETTTASDSGGKLHLQPGALVGARLGNFFELGAAARNVSRGDEGSQQTVVAAHAGVHGELGADRRFAVPLSVDVGAGKDISNYARINWGLRVRIYDELTIGVHPASPSYIKRERGPGRSGWAANSGVELSWGF